MSLQVSLEDGVGTIALDRPDQLNALTVEVAAGLGAAAERLVADGARVLVLAGRGKAFCAGADLSLVHRALAEEPAPVLTPLVEGLHGSLSRIRRLPVLVVAAVEGPAVGAGMGLALVADLRVMARSATLVPGYMGIGASPDGGVSYLLTRAVGAARATALLLRNRRIDAEEALALGLIESVADDGAALADATALAASLTGLPPLALLRVRDLVDAATTQGLDAQLDLEQRRVTELWDTFDFREGVGAFLERRRPSFQGR